MDGVERNTTFNGNFALNAVGGKEFNLGKKDKHRILGLSTRITYAGGGWYIPVDLEKSMEQGSEVLDESNGLSARADNFFKLNLALYYSRSMKRVSHTFKLDIENLTNYQAKVDEYYDNELKSIQPITQMAILPDFRYTLNF